LEDVGVHVGEGWRSAIAGFIPFLYDDHLVGESLRFFEVVGDEDRGNFERIEDPVELTSHLAAQVGIEGGEGFVEEKEARLPREGAGEGGALLLASGDFAGTAIGESGEAEAVEEFVDSLAASRLFEIAESVAEILRDGEMGKEGVVLKKKTDVALLRGQADPAIGVEPDRRSRGDESCVGMLESGEAAQDRRFSAAGGTEEGGDVAAFERDTQVARDLRAAVVSHREARDKFLV